MPAYRMTVPQNFLISRSSRPGLFPGKKNEVSGSLVSTIDTISASACALRGRCSVRFCFSHVPHRSHCGPVIAGVPIRCRSPRKRGPYSMPIHTLISSWRSFRSPREGVAWWRVRRAIRTTNLLERLFGEERRRTKVIPHAFGERAVLKLMYAALVRAAEHWRGIRITEFEQRQLRAIHAELNTDFAARNAPAIPASQSHLSSNQRT